MTARTRRSLLFVTLAVVALAAVISVAIVIRQHSAPEAARLLPQADAIVYVDLKDVRRLSKLGETKSQHDPDYQQFIDATGFEFERDLNEAAFAIHSSPGHDTRYSEIFIARFDYSRVSAYLRKISNSVERYRELDIYNIPVENRTVRVVLLGLDIAAISNTDDASIIHSMVDRYKEIALPFGGPGLVQDHYKHVPLGSLVWSIVRIPAAPTQPGAARNMTLPGGIDIFVPSASTMVASVRFLTSIDAKAEFFTASEADAKHFVDQAQTFLGIFQSLQASAQLNGSDPDVKAVFDSFKFEQNKDRAILTANIPIGFLKKLVSEPPSQLAPQQEPPPPVSVAPEKPKTPSKKHLKK